MTNLDQNNAARFDLLRATIHAEAKLAAQEYHYTVNLGEDRGACGFAWVKIIPQHKGNTKAGKEERAIFKALGFDKSWDGKTFDLWNPAAFPVQCVETAAAGARRAAAILREKGFNAMAQSRLD
jgi:hypothetical protein